METGNHRYKRTRKDLKEWFDKVKVFYRSLYKFRHGYAEYVLKKARDIKAL
jgi:hypothetical protein